MRINESDSVARRIGVRFSYEGARLAVGIGLAFMLVACAGLTDDSEPAGEETASASAAASQADVVFNRSNPTQVVLISIEGLVPEMYTRRNGAGLLDPKRSRVSFLSERAHAGGYADRVETAFPSLLHPTHATLMTGRRANRHGIMGDLPMDDHGLIATPYWSFTSVVGDSLLAAAKDHEIPAAVLNWPSTVGAPAEYLLPDVDPRPPGLPWLVALEGKASPGLVAILRELAPMAPSGDWPSRAERDRLITKLACSLVIAPGPPRLLMLRYGQLTSASLEPGIHSQQAREAIGAIDAHIRKLQGCFEESGLLRNTTFFVVGDRAFAPVHTTVRPNRILAEAGLLTPRPYGALYMVESWAALVRGFGGSAFVYARDERSAVLARAALSRAANETRAFRITSATELRAQGGDPEAWFGLMPEPGFSFDNLAEPPLLNPSPLFASDGIQPGAPGSHVGFVVWGAGIRRGVQIPLMRQIDVAPTIAALLNLELPETDGRVLIGALEPAVRFPQR